MDAPTTYHLLLNGGFALGIDGETLTVRPASRLTDVLRQAIRDHKPELMRMLREPAQHPAESIIEHTPPEADTASDRFDQAAVCALCRHRTPSPVNPTGGIGRCLADAPASREPGSLWPWPDAEIHCNEFALAPKGRAAHSDALEIRPTRFAQAAEDAA